MTDLLRKAMDEASKLPEAKQNGWAEAWLEDLSLASLEEEIASGTRPLPPKLQELIKKAEVDIAEGRTRPLEELFD